METRLYISRDDIFGDDTRRFKLRRISKSSKKNIQANQILPDSTFDLRTHSTTLTYNRTETCSCCNSNTQDIHTDTHKSINFDDAHKKIKRRPANYNRNSQEEVKKKITVKGFQHKEISFAKKELEKILMELEKQLHQVKEEMKEKRNTVANL